MKRICSSCIILFLLFLPSFGIVGSLSADQAIPCSAGMTICNETHCADLTSDESACGSCGNICEPGYLCINGTCVCSAGKTPNGTCICTKENILCNGTCVDKGFDDNNCGKCGNACASGSFCSEGSCYNYSNVTV